MPGPVQLRCPRCGSPRWPDGTWAELCPACLLANALDFDDGPCPFAVVAPLAEDATGITYLAEATSGRRNTVALKIYHQRSDINRVLERYERWRPQLAALTHPHVSRLLSVGLTDEGRLFKATEYVAGGPLAAWRDGADAADSAGFLGAIAHQLSAAFAAAHATGLRHLTFGLSHVRVTRVPAPHATVLGVGTRQIIDGDDDGDAAIDVEALVAALRLLRVDLPQRAYRSIADLDGALATAGRRDGR